MDTTYRITQTGQELQHLLDQITPNEQAITALEAGKVDKEEGKGLSDSNFTADEKAKLDNLPTSTELTQELGTKQDVIDDLATIRSGAEAGAAAAPQATTYTKSEVNAAIADFITRTVNNLTNYYLKSETYTQTEVQQLIAAVKQFRYQSVAELPTAGADTMGIIYLVPSSNPKTRNVKDEYITISTTNEQQVTTYSWEQIGSTTVDLSGYYTSEQTDAAITAALNTALASYSTTSQMNTAIAAALEPYYTKTEITALLAGKQDVINDLTTIRQQAAAAAPQSTTYTKSEVDAAIADFITRTVDNLTNYYLKSETYTQTEVQQLIAAVKQFRYVAVSSLPTASADTMGIIYLVPSSQPTSQNVKDEYITIETTEQGTTTYSWECIGSTTIDLSNYPTTAQMNAAIATALTTALASYYTKAQVEALDALIANRILYMEQCFGKYDQKREITLSEVKSGKYVDVTGLEAEAEGYGISNEVSVLAGDLLLIPSVQAVPADVSVVARVVTRTYQKVIVYTYTYQTENPSLYATATADYDPTLVYTAVYDTSGESPVLTGWTRDGQTYASLPATREVTESYYEPLVKQSTSAMPSTGFYIYLCPTPMTIVISGLESTVNGGVCQAVGWGIFKNICTNFVGAPGQAVIAQAFAQMEGEIAGLRAQLANLGEAKARSISLADLPIVCGDPLVIEGDGAPSGGARFKGQRYHDVTNSKVYEAFSVTTEATDWVLLN